MSNDLIKILLKAEVDPTSVQNIQTQINQIAKQVKPMNIKIDVDKESLKGVANVNKQMESIRSPQIDMSQANKGMGQFAKAAKSAQVNTYSFSKQASESSGILARSLENSFKFLRFYLVGGAIVGFVNSIKNGVESIKELDSAMVEVKKVTDEAEASYEKFTHTAFELGTTLGRTGTEVIQATADFARMGFTLSEATGLAEEALLMLNVGDGIENIDQATSSIIATLKGFEVDATRTAEETRRINDVYNEIANSFAVSTGDLAEGVKRTSAVMNQAGNSFDQTVAMFTGGFEVIQDSSKVSSGLNIITQRLKAMDMEGNKIEGLAPKLEKAFNDIGLSLYDTNGELKSTFENLQALSKIYPDLTKEQQNYIGELVSGKRQAVVLQAIMSNWQSVEDATVSATEATGSAMAENEKYLDSIEGRAKTLESTMQLFWKNLIDPEAIKTGINLITSLVEVLDTLINNNVSKAILKMGAFSAALMLGNKAFSLLKNNILENAPDSVYYTAETIAATIAQEGLGSAIAKTSAILWASPFTKTAIIFAGITGAIKLFNHLNVTLKEQKTIAEDLSIELKTLQTEYNELYTMDDRTDEQERYLQLLKREMDDKRELLLIEKERAIQQEFFMAQAGGPNSTPTNLSDSIMQDIENLKGLRKELEGLNDIDTIKKKKEEIAEIERRLNEYNITLTDYVMIAGDDALPATIDLINAIDGVAIALDDAEVESDDFNTELEDTKEMMNELTKQFDDVTNKIQTYNGFLDEINSKEGLSAKAKQDIITKYQELLPYISNEEELHRQLIAIIKQEEEVQREVYNQMLMHSQDFYNERILGNSKLVDEINKYYGVDLENFVSLADAKGKIEAELINQLGGMWSSYYGAVSRGNVNSIMHLEGIIAKGYNSTDAYMREAADSASDVLRTFYEIDQMKTKFDNFTVGFKGLDFSGINSKGIGGSKGGGSKAAKEQYKAIADAYARINLELDRNNVLLQLNRTRQDGAGKDTKKRLELIGQESELMKNRQGLLSQYNDQLREEGKKLQSQLSGIFRFEGKWSDNSIKIMDEDLGKIAGKGEKVDEQFKRIIAIMKELPKASQEWATLNNELKKLKETASQLEKEIISDRVASSKDWIEKRKYYDDWGADNEIAAWERVKAYIEQYYADGKINHKEYTDYILELDKNLERAQKDVWDSIRSNIDAEKRNIYMDFDIRLSVAQAELDKLKATMESEVNAIDVKIDGVQLEIEGIQESERLRAENKEREKRLTEISKLQDKYHNLQYGNLGDLSEAQAKLIGLEKEREQYLERQVKLQELQIQLANIQDQKNIRQLKRQSDGTWQFEYVADQKAIEDVNKQVESLQKEHDKTIKDLKEQTLDSLKKAQEDYDEWERNNDIQNSIKERQRKIKRYQDEIKDLQDNYAKKERETNRQFDDERRRLDNFYQDIDLLTDQKLKQLKDTFGDNWTLIAEVVKEHMNDIGLEYENMIDIMSKLEGFESGGRGFGDFVGGSDYSGYGSSSGGSGFKGMSSINPNYGVGAASGQVARDNESRLESDSAYRRSEILRTNQVIRDREMAGMDTSLQRKYLNRLQTGSYAQGGKITETGTFLANFHGKDNDPEWIFNDTQLQKVLKKAVLSTVELALPNIPRIATSASSSGDQIFQISSLEFPNVIDAQGVIDSIRGLPQLTVQKVRTS